MRTEFEVSMDIQIMKLQVVLLALILVSGLSGCAQLEQRLQLEAHTRQQAETPQLTPEQMYQYMLAEMMAARGTYEGAYKLLLPLAEQVRDVALAERLFALAMRTYDVGNIHQAAQLWHTLAPERPEPLNALWLVALRQETVPQAVQYFEQYQRVTPVALAEDVRQAAERMVDAVTQQKALAFFQQLRQACQQCWEADFGLGIFWLEKQQPLKAIGAFDRALAAQGEKALIYPYLARAYLQAKQVKAGMARLASYVDTHPENWRLQAEYGRLQIEAGDLSGAAQRFKDVLEIAPDADVARLALSLLLFEQGKQEVAKQHFEQLLDNPVTAPVAHYYLGRMAEQRGDWETAMVHYLQVRHSKYQLDALMRLVQIVYHQRGLDEALKILDALKVDHASAQVRRMLLRASLYQQAGKRVEAKQVAQQLEQRLQTDPDGLMQLAGVYYALGDASAYERVMRQVLSLSPENPDALNALGYFLVEQQRDLDEAKRLLEKAIQLKPDAFYIQDSIGWLYFRLGKLNEAEAWLRKALAQRKDEEVLAHLMQVLAAKKDQAGLYALEKKYADLLSTSETLRVLWRKIVREMSQWRGHGEKSKN